MGPLQRKSAVLLIMAGLGAGAASAQEDGQGASLEQMALQQPNELQGMDIALQDQQGEEQSVGSIKQLLLGRDDGELYVVFSSDEFLNLGGEDLVAALSELQLRDGKFFLNSEEAVEIFIREDFLSVQDA